MRSFHDHPYFNAATSLELLSAGFERVRQNKGCAGGDGVSISLFGFGLELRLRQLQLALRSGTYEPGPVARFDVPKPGRREKRVLHVPCVRDRVAQSAAHLAVVDLMEREFEPFSYGYRPGRSVQQALEAVERHHAAGFEWIVDADIRAYFDNVPHVLLLGALGAHVPERPFLDLVGKWLALSPTSGRGLPQGAPLSPMLANLYLDRVDEEIADAGYRMVRYADDFVILCRSEARAEKALVRVSRTLEDLGLELHPEKTVIRSLDEGYDFLGKRLSRSTLSRQLKELVAEADDPGGMPEDISASVSNDASLRLDGSLAVPGSRMMQGRNWKGAQARPVQDAKALDYPWDAEKAAVYLSEGGEPALLPTPVAGADVASRYAPFIRPLYIREPGLTLDVRQKVLSVCERDEVLALVPAQIVDRIDLFSGTEVTSAALRLAARQGLPVFLVDRGGAVEAAIHPEASSRPELHLAQARHALEPELSLDLARRFVAGRIWNQRRLLQRLRNRLTAEDRDERADLPGVIEKLDRAFDAAERDIRIGSVNEIRGVEARAGQLYWPALASLLKRGRAEAAFRRTRLPPETVFNCLLNWTAGLLRRDIETLVVRRGIHPGFGVLHTVSDARAGCIFDLMEEFRAPVAEALAAQLLSTGELGNDHFDTFEIDGKAGVWLVNGGGRKTLRAYERFIDKVVANPATGKRTTWRGLMDFQMTAYINHVTGERPYLSYRMDM